MAKEPILTRELAEDLLSGVEPETLRLSGEVRLDNLKELFAADELDEPQRRQVNKSMSAPLRAGYETVHDLRQRFDELPSRWRVGIKTLEFLGGVASIPEEDVREVLKKYYLIPKK